MRKKEKREGKENNFVYPFASIPNKYLSYGQERIQQHGLCIQSFEKGKKDWIWWKIFTPERFITLSKSVIFEMHQLEPKKKNHLLEITNFGSPKKCGWIWRITFVNHTFNGGQCVKPSSWFANGR